jgi:hypothetical protein
MQVNAMLATDSWKLVSGDEQGAVCKWDVETGALELRLLQHSLGDSNPYLLNPYPQPSALNP